MIYKDILVDHTSIHALISGVTDKKSLPWKALEVFHFIEEVLLSDRVWVCDTVNKQTAENTERFFDLLRKHGLSTYENTGSLVLTRFTKDDILSCCKSAAVDVDRYVNSVDVERLSDISKTNMLLRPKGSQPLDFTAVTKIPFGSNDAEEFIQAALKERGWLPMAAMPLLNPHLYRWLEDFEISHPSPDHYAYRQLNTIFRWQFNEKICKKLAGNINSPVSYVPAIGRVQTIEEVLSKDFHRKKAIVRSLIAEVIDREDDLKAALGGLTPTARYPLPFLGIWVFSQLSSNPTIDELFQKIAELRTDRKILRFKSLLQDIDEENAYYIQQELQAEVQDFVKKQRSLKQSRPKKFEASIKIPLLLFDVEIKKDFDAIALSNLIKKQIKRVTKDEMTVILTGLVEDCFSTLNLEDDTLDKLTSVLLSGKLT